MLNRQIGPSIFNTASFAALRIVNIGVKIDQSCSTDPTKQPGGENTSILYSTSLNTSMFKNNNYVSMFVNSTYIKLGFYLLIYILDPVHVSLVRVLT